MNFAATFALFALFVGAQSTTRNSQRSSAYTSTFQGCFNGRGGGLYARRYNGDNLNSRCIDYCREKSYPVAVTQSRLCACSNSLLGLLPQAGRPQDDNSTGPGSLCHYMCPGTPDTGNCNKDTCCGGPTAYSVFVVGNVDSVRSVLSRAQSALSENNNELLKTLWQQTTWPDFTLKYSTRLYDHYRSYMTNNAAECWNKCKELDDCQGSSWSDPYHMANPTVNCFLYNSYAGRETQETGWTSYLKGRERDYRRANSRLVYGPDPNDKYDYFRYYDVDSALKCRQACLIWRNRCGSAVYFTGRPDHPGTGCWLYEYGKYLIYYGDDASYSFIFESPSVEVETTATALNSAGEQAGPKRCTQGSTYYSCSHASSSTVAMDMEVTEMDRQLMHTFGKDLRPLGTYDYEVDNTGSTLPAKATKVVRITEASSRTWNTETGSDVRYTVGTKLSASFGYSFWGLSVSLSAEISKEVQKGSFFKQGFSETTTKTLQEEFRLEYTVPAGEKLEINFFKETYPVYITWRSLLLASGKLNARIFGISKSFYLSEVLSRSERAVYAFGTMDLGDHERVVTLVKEIRPKQKMSNSNKMELHYGNVSTDMVNVTRLSHPAEGNAMEMSRAEMAQKTNQLMTHLEEERIRNNSRFPKAPHPIKPMKKDSNMPMKGSIHNFPKPAINDSNVGLPYGMKNSTDH